MMHHLHKKQWLWVGLGIEIQYFKGTNPIASMPSLVIQYQISIPQGDFGT